MKKIQPVLFAFLAGLLAGAIWPNLFEESAWKINGMSDLMLLKRCLSDTIDSRSLFLYLLEKRGSLLLLTAFFWCICIWRGGRNRRRCSFGRICGTASGSDVKTWWISWIFAGNRTAGSAVLDLYTSIAAFFEFLFLDVFELLEKKTDYWKRIQRLSGDGGYSVCFDCSSYGA